MKFVFITYDGSALPVAYRLQREENEVFIGIIDDPRKLDPEADEEDKESKSRRFSLFQGLIRNRSNADTLIEELSKIPEKERDDYFVIFDSNNLYPYADKVRAMGGYKGFFPTKEDHSLEEDRQKGKELVKKRYPFLEIADTHEFKKVDDAIAFMEESADVPYVVKAFSKDAFAIVPESNIPEVNHKKIANVLTKNAEAYESKGFILEEKIIDIIEFTPEAVAFDGKLLGVSIDIEAKGLGAGDSGRQTGCSLDLVMWLSDEKKVYDMFLKPIEDMMFRKNELTVWDASVYYSPSRKCFYFGEFCFNRWGYNAIFSELATFESATEYFQRLVAKQKLFEGSTKQFGTSITVFNLVEDKEIPGGRIKDGLVTTEDNRDIWLWDVKKEADGEMYNCGVDQNLAVITGAASDINDAVDDAYKIEGKFHWLGKYKRPRHDFLAKDYDTSIVHRYNVLNHFIFEAPDIKMIFDITPNNYQEDQQDKDVKERGLFPAKNKNPLFNKVK